MIDYLQVGGVYRPVPGAVVFFSVNPYTSLVFPRDYFLRKMKVSCRIDPAAGASRIADITEITFSNLSGGGLNNWPLFGTATDQSRLVNVQGTPSYPGIRSWERFLLVGPGIDYSADLSIQVYSAIAAGELLEIRWELTFST